MKTRTIRIIMSICAILLFGAELYIGLFQHDNWIRAYLGDVLVIMLLYCIIRIITPNNPKYGLLLPIALLLFCFAVEGLQAWHIVDKLHIENALLRTLIGTSFSWKDILSYCIGYLPIQIWELLLHKKG